MSDGGGEVLGMQITRNVKRVRNNAEVKYTTYVRQIDFSKLADSKCKGHMHNNNNLAQSNIFQI